MKVTLSHPTLCNQNSLDQNTGVGSLSLLRGTFPTQGSISHIADRFFTNWAGSETSIHPSNNSQLAWNHEIGAKQGPGKEGAIWGEGSRVCDFVLIGWWEARGRCSRNLVLSLKLPSSTWVGLQFCQRTQRYCYAYSLSRKRDPALRLYYHLTVQFIQSCRPRGLQHARPPCPSPTARVYSNSLDCSSPVFVSRPFPGQQLFESALWNSGNIKEAEWSVYPINKKQKTERPQNPVDSCSL